MPQRNAPTTKTHFRVLCAKIYVYRGELWLRSRNKHTDKAHKGTTSPICPSPFATTIVFTVCQISGESVKEVSEPHGSKMTSADLAYRPYNSVRTDVHATLTNPATLVVVVSPHTGSKP